MCLNFALVEFLLLLSLQEWLAGRWLLLLIGHESVRCFHPRSSSRLDSFYYISLPAFDLLFLCSWWLSPGLNLPWWRLLWCLLDWRFPSWSLSFWSLLPWCFLLWCINSWCILSCCLSWWLFSWRFLSRRLLYLTELALVAALLELWLLSLRFTWEL